MKKSEGLLAMERMSGALDATMGDITKLSDATLQGFHEMLWAATQDIEHEWVRRRMREEANVDEHGKKLG